MDFRLVPGMKAADVVPAIKAHLAKRGFGDIEVNMSGGYDPTQHVGERAADPGADRGAEARRNRSGACGRATPARIPVSFSPASR